MSTPAPAPGGATWSDAGGHGAHPVVRPWVVVGVDGSACAAQALLGSGRMPYERPGRHRRVRLADLLVYRDVASTERVRPSTS